MHAFLALILLGLPALALANAGLPMLIVVWPLSLGAIIPVIALESWVVERELGVGWRIAIRQVSKANIFSTLLGLPLTWLALVVLEFVLASLVISTGASRSYPPQFFGEVGRTILAAPWLGPITRGEHWIVPVATISLLIPFFFASYWSETWLIADRLSPSTPALARQALWRANLASYLLLLAGCVVWLVIGIFLHG
ncbi:hypothetical protein ACLIKD_16670 [Azonexus sp. IMCC34842]|uniref:hypothetical protein n=1 Tax=Azonexus sp. IMCC34842 TaxID=3420950 RepID=UPI003D09A902